MRKFFVFVIMLLLVGFVLMAQSSKAQTTCPDRDGDGVCDRSDACISDPGPASNNGCPRPQTEPEPTRHPDDRDGDGTYDSQDRCPDAGGPAQNGGCPEGQGSETEEPSCVSITAAPNCNPNEDSSQQPELPPTGRCVLGAKFTDRVNVRIRPSTLAEIVAQLEPDAIVPVLDWMDMSDGRWYRIDNGWVFGDVIRLGGDCSGRDPQDGDDESELVDCPSMQLLSPVDTTVSGNTLFSWTSPISEVPVAFYQISLYDASNNLLLDEWTFEPTTEVLIDIDALGLGANASFKWEVTALDNSEYWLCRTEQVNATTGTPGDENELVDCPSMQLLSPVDTTVSGNTLFSWTSPISEVPVAFYQISLYDADDNWLFDAWTFEPTTQVWIDIDSLGLPANTSIKWEVTALDESEYWLCRTAQANDTTGTPGEEPEMVDCPSMQLLSPVDTTVSGNTLFSWTSPISEVPVAFYQISLYDASNNLLLDEWTFEPTTEVLIDIDALGLGANASFKWEVTALDNSEYWLCRTEQVNATTGTPGDADGDGVPNTQDRCPRVAGSPELNGCPEATDGDSDGDTVPDEDDHCTNFAGLLVLDGCPPTSDGDTDGDGTPDGQDECYDVTGAPSTAGCPDPSDGDSDGDQVDNEDEHCTTVPGIAAYDGCPDPSDDDDDGDSVPDDSDECLDAAGIAATNGCPNPQEGDSDGDGVDDEDDACPEIAGLFVRKAGKDQQEYFTSGNDGCPEDDHDGDGVPNTQDRCPRVAGSPELNGCPEATDGDSDGDTVPDEDDHCTNFAGLLVLDGCPPTSDGDTDGDGTPDGQDECYDVTGAPSTAGCPDPSDGDDDGDQVDNEDEHCTTVPGIAAYNGCPDPSDDDDDGDSVPDDSDECLDAAGIAATNGCPNPQEGDSDGDGVDNEDDACPEIAGLFVRKAGKDQQEYLVNGQDGCPNPSESDVDGDGVPNEADECPELAGSPELNGCPEAAEGDGDGDGVSDAEDHCSRLAGLPEFDGCPPPTEGDGDGDGTGDEQDECYDVTGALLTTGCPDPSDGDTDGDEVDNEDDHCSRVPGVAANNGCRIPSEEDADGDGVMDARDECPETAGFPATDGCPEPTEGDADGDGVDNEDDACPEIAGVMVRKAGGNQQEYATGAPQEGCQPANEPNSDS